MRRFVQPCKGRRRVAQGGGKEDDRPMEPPAVRTTVTMSGSGTQKARSPRRSRFRCPEASDAAGRGRMLELLDSFIGQRTASVVELAEQPGHEDETDEVCGASTFWSCLRFGRVGMHDSCGNRGRSSGWQHEQANGPSASPSRHNCWHSKAHCSIRRQHVVIDSCDDGPGASVQRRQERNGCRRKSDGGVR